MRKVLALAIAAWMPGCGGSSPDDLTSPGGGDISDAGLADADADAYTPDCEPERVEAVNGVLTAAPATQRRIVLSAKTHWFDTGFYLKAEERLTVRATGTWNHGTGASSPDGFGNYEGCPFASLIGSLGLELQDGICLGSSFSQAVLREGPLFLKINDGLLDDNSGSLTVDVTVERPRRGLRIPSEDVPCVDWDLYEQQEVEVFGEHVALVLPADFTAAHAGEIPTAIETYDGFYRDQADLAGARPYDGERIRIVVDRGLPYFGIAGNPIRYQPAALAGPRGQYHVARPNDTYQAWLWVHELGHDFDAINRGLYQVGNGGSEGWPNLFSLYSLEQVNHPQAVTPPEEPCRDRAAHLESGQYASLRDDPWLHLCMLLEIRDQAGGWAFYRRFFTWYNELSPLPEFGDETEQWRWIRDSLNRFASEDVTPILRAYHVPL